MAASMGAWRLNRREHSYETVLSSGDESSSMHSGPDPAREPKVATLWVHDDSFSKEDVLINEDLFHGSIKQGSLLEIVTLTMPSDIRDFSTQKLDSDYPARGPPVGDEEGANGSTGHHEVDRRSRCLCIAKFAPDDLKAKNPSLQVSVTSTIATTFGFRNRSQILLSLAEIDKHTASHIEIGFRDTYLARSDMWRLVCGELVGRTLYTGQKIQFLGTIRAVIKNIHVSGRRVSTALFNTTTLPIFRSEAARFVLFIQMSQEMWDFDSEGNGEILFNRVINGFLPDLFQRWSDLEVKHLVSIVMFARLEYSHHDMDASNRQRNNIHTLASSANASRIPHRDFYRVVVADMASAHWTTILNELKKDFRVFLRDVCLEPMEAANIGFDHKVPNPKIAGYPSSALKGNILEAINIAASQFANDHVDRDLVRTGVSVVVVTAGTGVYEVDRDLLKLTSENLTNNGIGIDVVCLSKMPLHSAPLFKYKALDSEIERNISGTNSVSESPRTVRHPLGYLTNRSLDKSSNASSVIDSTLHSLSRYASSFASESGVSWCFGIPQWIDLSYWAPANELESRVAKRQRKLHEYSDVQNRNKRFVPRVRMYEIQMLGTEDSGLADIVIPYMVETQKRATRYRGMNKAKKISGLSSAGRSLSTSPKLVRREGPELSATPVKSEGLLSSNAKQQGDVFNRMHDYDDSLFASDTKHVSGRTRSASPRTSLQSSHHGPKSSNKVHIPPLSSRDAMNSTSRKADESKAPKIDESMFSHASEKQAPVRGPQPSRISRTISLAFKGFAPPARAVASTEVKAEHARAQPSQQRPIGAQRTLTASSESIKSYQHTSSRPQSIIDLSESDAELGSASMNMNINIINISKPISINTSSRKVPGVEKESNLPDYGDGSSRIQQVDHSLLLEKEKVNCVASSGSDDSVDEAATKPLDPKTFLPFIRSVNASNPIKKDPNAASWYGRWQHLYPRKPKAATVRWRSLCTPASVPLTTEEFPALERLEMDYDPIAYSITQDSTNELLEHPENRESLLQEMISIRLAHGYQLVVRPDLASPESRPCDPSSFFAPTRIAESSNTIYLYMGNTIQRLSYSDDSHVLVTKFVRKIDTKLDSPRSINYCPYIRTTLSEKYRTRVMSLTGFSEEYPWELVDGYLAGNKKDLNNAVEKLRFWRARFVLIPVEPPSNAYKLAPWMNDENEEEIHLRGISALTQVWQKNRYIPPDERGKFKPSAGRRRDTNPLEIIFRTLNPSEVVATELDIATEEPGDMNTTQLLPESELLERETSNLPKIAQAMQGDKGIEIKNRRWHLRLHYNCFRGEEFINWILQNFKDVTTREEAVHFGNELMEHGLFNHVNGRHTFKDGHFFYSVEPEYRFQKSDLRQSWFPGSRRSDRTVPPTPMSENVPRESPLTVRSRSSSSAATEGNEKPASSLPRGSGEKKRVSVSLSKMIRLDVDHRKRSNRLEVVNLHYDRLHNPENCYHMELSWLNVTSKLVEDAIVSWATQSEKYGLKLVEVPIAEACDISNYEPFRAPYPICLAIPPPQKPTIATNTYFTATSFGPQIPQSSTADHHLYQKALLKRFNFVLDLEAASEFPEDVEIRYSWGKLEYRYTQFLHRSGVILAQIKDDGSFLLAANRLYNIRHTAAKHESTAKFANSDSAKSKDHPNRNLPQQHPPTLPASGILALNPPNTNSPAPSPMVRASADVLGTRAALVSANLTTYTTPEAIKDELESFCNDPQKLEAFYKEVTASMAAAAPQRKSSSTSSSVLRAYRPTPGSGMDIDSLIPDIRLPERLMGGSGWQGGRKVSPQVQVQTQPVVGESGSGNAGGEEKLKDSPKRKYMG